MNWPLISCTTVLLGSPMLPSSSFLSFLASPIMKLLGTSCPDLGPSSPPPPQILLSNWQLRVLGANIIIVIMNIIVFLLIKSYLVCFCWKVFNSSLHSIVGYEMAIGVRSHTIVVLYVHIFYYYWQIWTVKPLYKLEIFLAN